MEMVDDIIHRIVNSPQKEEFLSAKRFLQAKIISGYIDREYGFITIIQNETKRLGGKKKILDSHIQLLSTRTIYKNYLTKLIKM